MAAAACTTSSTVRCPSGGVRGPAACRVACGLIAGSPLVVSCPAGRVHFRLGTAAGPCEMPVRQLLCLGNMDIELRHLRAFVAVAEERSFTYAAAGLHITQPALSRTIRQLEEALRVKLIARTSRSFDLTREGREFHDRARRILADLDEAVRGARGSAVFRLGFSWLLPSPWAQQAAARFTEVSGMVVSFV